MGLTLKSQRFGAKTLSVVSGAMVLALASGCGSSEPQTAATAAVGTRTVTSPPTAPTPTLRTCASYGRARHRPQNCRSSTGFSCDSYDRASKPTDCLPVAAQRYRARLARAQARAQAKEEAASA